MNATSFGSANAKGGMADNGELLVWVPANLVKGLQKATSEVPYALSHAGNVFAMLQRLTGAGFALSEGELVALCELCHRGLSAMAEDEGEVLADFDRILRDLMRSSAGRGDAEGGDE